MSQLDAVRVIGFVGGSPEHAASDAAVALAEFLARSGLKTLLVSDAITASPRRVAGREGFRMAGIDDLCTDVRSAPGTAARVHPAACQMDVLLADAGPGFTPRTRAVAAAANHLVLRAEPTLDSCADALGLLKLLRIDGWRGTAHLLMVGGALRDASGAARRLCAAARRFLRVDLSNSAWLPPATSPDAPLRRDAALQCLARELRLVPASPRLASPLRGARGWFPSLWTRVASVFF